MSDLISRQAMLDGIDELIKIHFDRTVVLYKARKVAEDLPPVWPERLNGKWIHQSKFSRIECDQCGKVFRNTFAPKNFCPNCGADMRYEG